MRDDQVAVAGGAERDQGMPPLDGRAAVEQRDLCLAEQLDHCGGIEAVRACRGEPPPQDSRRRRGLALCEEQRGDRLGGLLAPLDAAQHPDRVLQTSLREPEFGERPDANACGGGNTPLDIAIASVSSVSAAPQSPFSKRTRP